MGLTVVLETTIPSIPGDGKCLWLSGSAQGATGGGRDVRGESAFRRCIGGTTFDVASLVRLATESGMVMSSLGFCLARSS